MAIQIDRTMDTGISYTAYTRLHSISGGKAGAYARFTMHAHKDKPPVEFVDIEFVPDMTSSSMNIIAQAYAALKAYSPNPEAETPEYPYRDGVDV